VGRQAHVPQSRLVLGGQLPHDGGADRDVHAAVRHLAHDRLVGRVSVVTGPSGVGKSTLLNAIQPGLRIETGVVSEAVHKGRHTTTSAELHPLTGPGGGYVADTPGLRELGLWQVPPEELAWGFPEMRELLGQCGFNDCRHLNEPRCAVLAAVAAGRISEARHDSYRRLLLNED